MKSPNAEQFAISVSCREITFVVEFAAAVVTEKIICRLASAAMARERSVTTAALIVLSVVEARERSKSKDVLIITHVAVAATFAAEAPETIEPSLVVARLASCLTDKAMLLSVEIARKDSEATAMEMFAATLFKALEAVAAKLA
jgi:hypothetical protein